MRMLLQNVALEAKEALHHPAFPYLWGRFHLAQSQFLSALGGLCFVFGFFCGGGGGLCFEDVLMLF